MAEHAILGASSSERWLACAQSVQGPDGLLGTTSRYAIEGSAAHEVAAACLMEEREAIEFLDRTITITEGETAYKVLCDEEMVDGIQMYLDLCRELGGEPGTRAFTEHRVSLNELRPPHFEKPMFGTCDHGIAVVKARRLIVIDFKYGQGVAVDVKGNTQARYYALGLLLDPALIDEVFDEIELIICQPRAQHADGPIRREITSPEALVSWGTDVLMPGAVRTLDPNAPYVPGPHCHSHFCPRAGNCKALREHALTVVGAAFDDLDAVPVVGAPPAPNTLTVEQFAQILDHTEEYMGWLRAAREYAFGLMNAGIDIPGWKIVDKRGRRKWIAEDPNETAVRLVYEHGLPPDAIWQAPKLLSPNAVEVLMSKRFMGRGVKDRKAKLYYSGAYETPVAGVTLARAADPRPAVTGQVLSKFEALE